MEEMSEGKSGTRISTKLAQQANYVKKVVYTPIWTRHGVLFNYNPPSTGTRCSDGTLDKDFKAAGSSILSFQHNLGAVGARAGVRVRARTRARAKAPDVVGEASCQSGAHLLLGFHYCE